MLKALKNRTVLIGIGIGALFVALICAELFGFFTPNTHAPTPSSSAMPLPSQSPTVTLATATPTLSPSMTVPPVVTSSSSAPTVKPSSPVSTTTPTQPSTSVDQTPRFRTAVITAPNGWRPMTMDEGTGQGFYTESGACEPTGTCAHLVIGTTSQIRLPSLDLTSECNPDKARFKKSSTTIGGLPAVRAEYHLSCPFGRMFLDRTLVEYTIGAAKSYAYWITDGDVSQPSDVKNALTNLRWK